MKKLAFLLLTAVVVVGCNQVIPSFWDDNESRRIIDIRYAVDRLDCSAGHDSQAEIITELKGHLRWLQLYSESKGSGDLQALLDPMQETVDSMNVRYVKAPTRDQSTFYCESKKEILEQQASIVAKGILGRY